MKRAQFRSVFRSFLLATVTMMGSFMMPSANAVDTIWTGGTDTDWTFPDNWSGGTPTGTDNAVFSGTFSNQPNVGTTAVVGGIWMTGTPGVSPVIGGGAALTINANTINAIGGLGILVDNTDAQTLTIAAPLILGNAQTWRNSSSNVLTVSGGIDTNGNALIINGTGDTTVGGISGSGDIKLNGTGVTTFSGANNTYTSTLTVASGTLSIAAFNQNGGGGGPFGVNSNAVVLGDSGTTGTIQYTGPTNASARNRKFTLATGGTGAFDIPTDVSIILAGKIDGSGRFTKEGPGTLTLTGATNVSGIIQGSLTYTGLTTVNDGILSVIAGSSGTAFTGGITGSGTVRSYVTSGNQSLTVGGPINTFTGTFQLAAGAANQFSLDGSTPESTDGSHALFVIMGKNLDTNTTNRTAHFGNINGIMVKIGGLVSATGVDSITGIQNDGGFISPDSSVNGIGNGIHWEIGALGGDRLFTGDLLDGSDYARVASITKVGAGSQTFAGANSNYSGTTIVSSGTLIVGANVNSTRLVQKATSVDINSDVFTTSSDHGLHNGDQVVLDARSGALTGATNDSVSYYVINASPNTFQISTISGGSAVDITADATIGLNVEYGVAADSSADKVAIANHAFQNGDKVMLGIVTGGTMIGGLTSNKPYYVVNASANDFQVATTAGGTPVDLTADGNAVFVRRPGALGAGDSPVVLGDANTGSNDVAFLIGGPFRIERDIDVTGNGSGATILGGNTDDNVTISGAISLSKNVKLMSAATGGHTLNVSGVISGDGFGITKVGAGTATLSAASTYTGNTVVQKGTLSITNAFLADASAVYLDTANAVLDLSFSGADSISALYFDNVAQSPGTYGATGSGATNIFSWFTGTGTLSVGSVGLDGDFNHDNVVDAADYVVWRKTLGDATNYDLWRSNFGNHAGSGNGSSLGGSPAVPEPSFTALALLGSVFLCSVRRGANRCRTQ